MNYSKWLKLLMVPLIAFGLGYYFAPEKITVETKVVTEKVVEEKIRVRTVVRELPSGEKITTIAYQSDTVENKKSSHQKKKVVDKRKPQWSVALGRSVIDYTIAVDRRILGNIFVGVSVTGNELSSDISSGIYLRYSF